MAQTMTATSGGATAGHNSAGLHKVIRECAASMEQIDGQRKALNEEAAEIRERLRDAGIQTKTFDLARRIKSMEAEGRSDYLDSLRTNFAALLPGGQGELFIDSNVSEGGPDPKAERVAAKAAGHAAGLAGNDAGTNPYKKTDPLAGVWSAAWVEGQTELAKGLTPKGAAPAKPKRTRKRKSSAAKDSDAKEGSHALAMEDGKAAGLAGKGSEDNPHVKESPAAAFWEAARKRHFKAQKGAAKGTNGAAAPVDLGPLTVANTAGFKAAEAGDGEDANPNPEGTPEHDYWLRGHRAAVKLDRAQAIGGGPADAGPDAPAAA